jgi:hypothetical protein
MTPADCDFQTYSRQFRTKIHAIIRRKVNARIILEHSNDGMSQICEQAHRPSNDCTHNNVCIRHKGTE